MPQEPPPILSIRQRLKNLAQARHVTLNEVLRLYFLDGFLQRVAASPARDQFVLGGAMVLYKIGLGPLRARHTQDADFSVQGLPNDSPSIRRLLQTIVALPAPDELRFDPASVTVAPILLANPQLGLQAHIAGFLGKARDIITLDCSFDPIAPPGPQQSALPPTLPGAPPIALLIVPVEGIMAGKVESMLRRGATNTRYKDYWDIAQLAATRAFAGDHLQVALRATCAAHGTPLDPTAVALASPTFPTDPTQLTNWANFLTRLRTAQAQPIAFSEAIARLRALYTPVVLGAVAGKTWSPHTQQWV